LFLLRKKLRMLKSHSTVLIIGETAECLNQPMQWSTFCLNPEALLSRELSCPEFRQPDSQQVEG
jgi:hypothetical protein